MSKNRGLSVDEKRQRMMKLLYEKKDVFQLKELEKIAPKDKGIVAQSVKDVLQSLVDDGMIDSEKIGTSVYFWAFPSKAANNGKRKISELREREDQLRKKLKTINDHIQKAQLGRESDDEREKLLSVLHELEECNMKLVLDVRKYKDCDPEVLKNLKVEIMASKDAANRWTDNIFAVKSWCKGKFYMEESVLNKQFNVPDDLDYIP